MLYYLREAVLRVCSSWDRGWQFLNATSTKDISWSWKGHALGLTMATLDWVIE